MYAGIGCNTAKLWDCFIRSKKKIAGIYYSLSRGEKRPVVKLCSPYPRCFLFKRSEWISAETLAPLPRAELKGHRLQIQGLR